MLSCNSGETVCSGKFSIIQFDSHGEILAVLCYSFTTMSSQLAKTFGFFVVWNPVTDVLLRTVIHNIVACLISHL